jgi:hypothetical protein
LRARPYRVDRLASDFQKLRLTAGNRVMSRHIMSGAVACIRRDHTRSDQTAGGFSA